MIQVFVALLWNRAFQIFKLMHLYCEFNDLYILFFYCKKNKKLKQYYRNKLFNNYTKMNMNNISNLPKELQILISEYNVKHRQQFYWSLHQLKNPTYCEVCDKYIKKYIYSNRRGDEICCSTECLNNYHIVFYRDY